MVQPSPQTSGTQNGQGTMQVQVKTAGTLVVIDGLMFERGGTIAYNAKGEGQPEGVETPMMMEIGEGGKGGQDLSVVPYQTVQTS
jgi:hypothetical protein